ncbi:hypothetical protein FQZ97_763790 [compost metagenome]
MDAGQRDELVLVAQRGQVFLERRNLLVVEVLLPVEGRRAVVRQQLAGAGTLHRLGELTGKTDVGHAGLAPHQVSVGRVGDAAADGLLQAVLDAVETFLRALAGQEGLVIRIVVAGDQIGGLSVGAGQHNGGHTHHVGGEARGNQLFAGFLRGHEHLATHMAAFLHGSQLVFEVHASGTGRDHVLHQLESVEHTTKPGFGIRHDRQEVVDELGTARFDATAPLDFVGALEGVVDAADHRRHRVVGVQRLVGVHGFRGVAVSGDLPARQIHGFQASLGLLHGLTCGDGAKGIDVTLLGAAVDLVPQLLGTAFGQRVFDLHAAAQTHDVSG